MSEQNNPINVADIIAKYSISELIESANQYFHHVDRAALKRKPFNCTSEFSEVLITFAHAVKGLKLPIGSTILDFGAGSCWSSKYLSDLGYKVIACDVSKEALDLGREVTATARERVDFLLFDGYTIELPDESIDAITCLSAFHHTPNPDRIVQEFARVLKPWGVAAFSEPGPNHSKTPQSQHEMRNYKVVENDVDIERIWDVASGCGFTTFDMDLFYPEPVLVTYAKFKDFLNGERPFDFEAQMRRLMAERRLFFLEKGLPGISNSAEKTDLDALIVTSCSAISCAPGEAVSIKVTVTNTGKALWRPSDWYLGPVRLGPSIVSDHSGPAYTERWQLPVTTRRGVLPGEQIELNGTVTAPSVCGEYRIHLQMVSESVAWFGGVAAVQLSVV